MLGRNYRFSVNNQLGVNATVTIQARKWKLDSSGALVYSSEAQEFNESAIASSSSAWTEDTAIDNSSDLYFGADLEIVVTPASTYTASATTVVSVQIQRSTDGGTTWPDDGRGETIFRVAGPGSTTVFTSSVQIE